MDGIDFATLVIVGFTACAEFGSYAFVHPVIRQLPAREHIRVEQGLVRTFGRVMPLLMPLCVIALIAQAVRQWPAGGAAQLGPPPGCHIAGAPTLVGYAGARSTLTSSTLTSSAGSENSFTASPWTTSGGYGLEAANSSSTAWAVSANGRFNHPQGRPRVALLLVRSGRVLK